MQTKTWRSRRLVGVALLVTSVTIVFAYGQAKSPPDISSVKADLVVPEMVAGQPARGKRVQQTHPDYAQTKVHHALYLPTNWKPGGRFPVIVELAGNGPYSNGFGDLSSGLVQGSKLGFGMSAGKDYIWLCIPYLNNAGTANVTRWWGDRPKFDPRPTIEYCLKTVPWICRTYGGDERRVVLAGFSRGAIAVNFIGLHDDRIAKLWCGLMAYSHYDGVSEGWGYPGADRQSALVRLKRLGDRPQFISHEVSRSKLSLRATRDYLEGTGVGGKFTFVETGFRNHNDAWTLRPSPARKKLREWLKATTAERSAASKR